MIYLISKKNEHSFQIDLFIQVIGWNEDKYIYYSVIFRSGFYHQSISRNSLPAIFYT